MGSNIVLGFEGEVPQLAGRIRRLPSPSIFFIIVRGGLCACPTVAARARVGERVGRRVGNVSWKKENVSGRGRSVPADRSIGRDFKADCPYKVKNFPPRSEHTARARITSVCACVAYTWPVCAYSHYRKSLAEKFLFLASGILDPSLASPALSNFLASREDGSSMTCDKDVSR